MEIQAREDNADIRVQGRAIRDIGVILLPDVAPEGTIRSSNVAYPLRCKLCLNATFSEYEDLVARRWQLEDARDVDSRGVCTPKDLILMTFANQQPFTA